MTNNPTIGGVSRELLADLVKIASRNVRSAWSGGICEEARALLDAPVVERQPIGYVHQWEMERIAAGNAHWATMWDSDGANNPSRNGSPAMAVYLAPPEVAALQSTIAQLQARIAELESVRGEPVAWRYKKAWRKTGWMLQSTEPDPVEVDREGNTVQPLFTAPPAPVAVVLPEREFYTQYMLGVIPTNAKEVNAYKDGWNACLDATAALNEVKS